MGSHDKLHQKKSRLLRSFGYAYTGIYTGIRKERNLQIHLTIAGIVILFGLILSITTVEWLFITIAIGGMLAAELMNSALERVVDITTKEYHPLAKQAKDMAAGAVLVFAVTSVVIGLLIFAPRLFSMLNF